MLKQQNSGSINRKTKFKTSERKKYNKTDVSILHDKGCSIKVVGTAHRYSDIIKDIMNGPWQCKDISCKNSITESTITYNSNKKQLRQDINCLCGCHYIISLDTEESKKKRVIIMNYSHKTNEIILEQHVERGMGYRKIAEGLEIPTSYVKRYIAKENVVLHKASKYKMLEIASAINESEVANYFLGNYIELIVDFPYTSRSIFLKYLWDAYIEMTGYTGSLYQIMIDKNEKIISDSIELIRDYRNGKRKSKTSIEENKVLMRAIAYLKAFAKDELDNIILNLPNKVCDTDIEQIITYIESEREKSNEVTRKHLWKKYPRQMHYFKEKYPEYFAEFLPNKNATKGMLGVNKKVNKSEIKKENDRYDKDNYYELLINNASENLIKREPPIKITKALIRKRLGGLKVGDLNKQRYPKAVAAITKACESSLEYRFRACKYVIDKIDAAGGMCP